MLALCYQEALQENGCLDLLELQDASQHLSWKAASANEVTFACYLANMLDIRVEWAPFHPDLIASAPDATLSALACQVANNATHYVKLGKKRRESSKRNYYIISPGVIIKAIIIIKLPLSIQIEGVMLTATCRDTGLDSTMTIQVGDR